MKYLSSKALKSNQLSQEMEQFLSKGGQVAEIAQGISGRENPMSALLPILFNDKTLKRTDARQALNAIDARKHSKTPAIKVKPAKKVPVYDDFGEILRWVWEK